MTGTEIETYAAAVATPTQLAALAKMTKMGWKVTKVAGTKSEPLISLGVKSQAVWLKADGSLIRPEAGRKCAVAKS